MKSKFQKLALGKIFKNSILALSVFAVLFSCDKNAIQQTTNTIKQADSLFKNVNAGYKTLDSISKIVGDSSKLGNEIRKQKEVIEKNINIKNINVKNLDSLSDALKKMSKNVENGTDIVKTIDSATNALKNSSNPIDAISTISKTIEKVSKKTKSTNQNQSQNQSQTPQQTQPQIPNSEPQQNAQNQQNPIVNQQPIEKNPISKTASLDITVKNISDSRNNLAMILRDFGSEIVTENFTDQEGVKKQYLSAKVPYKYFNEAVNKISENLGETTSKNIATEGTDYDANQMCDINVTLKQDEKYVATDISGTPDTDTKPDTFGEKSTDAFSKGFNGFKDVLVALIPFWPVAVIGALVWYFVARSKRKKLEAELERQRALNQQLANQNREKAEQTKQNQYTERQYATKPEDGERKDDDDISRYMPK